MICLIHNFSGLLVKKKKRLNADDTYRAIKTGLDV